MLRHPVAEQRFSFLGIILHGIDGNIAYGVSHRPINLYCFRRNARHKVFIITQDCLNSTNPYEILQLCSPYSFDVEFTVFSAGCIFPTTFSVEAAFERREAALHHLANLKVILAIEQTK